MAADSARVRPTGRFAPARPSTERRKSTFPKPTVVAVVGRRMTDIPTALRLEMIREAAYRRAEARQFAPGGDVADWLAAEAEVDEIITRRYQN